MTSSSGIAVERMEPTVLPLLAQVPISRIGTLEDIADAIALFC
jgi:hypothetical protein